ncbi:MAG TPA: energy transducer TonB [Limnobacter sp.]|nr:energy transducer TonB [Limnobacter sp.]
MTTLPVTSPQFPNYLAARITDLLALMAVLLVHAAGLYWAARQLQITQPEALPPSVVGVLVAPQPKVAPPPPAPPRPEKTVPPKPVKQLEQTPKPLPTPVAKPLPAPQSEPVRESTPVQAAPAPVETPAAPPAPPATAPETAQPVTPPRTDAAHLNNPAPQYPALSRRLGEQGRVMLDVYILPDGSVGDIKLNKSSGFPRLDNAALQAVKTWKYVPAKRGDKPIPFWYVQPVSFVLNN